MVLCHDIQNPSQGLHSSHTITVLSLTTRGSNRAVLGLMHTDKQIHRGKRAVLFHRGDTDGWSLIKSSLQDALKWEGDKFEALAWVELILELHPEKGEQEAISETWGLRGKLKCTNRSIAHNKTVVLVQYFSWEFEEMKVLLKKKGY